MTEEHQAAAAARTEASKGWSHVEQDRAGIHTLSSCLFVDSRKAKILQWLSSENLIARHSTICEDHINDTGLWLLDELQRWFDGNGPRLIICQGPGNVFLFENG